MTQNGFSNKQVIKKNISVTFDVVEFFLKIDSMPLNFPEISLINQNISNVSHSISRGKNNDTTIKMIETKILKSGDLSKMSNFTRNFQFYCVCV